MKIPNIKTLVSQVKASLKKSDTIISDSKQYLKKLPKSIENAEKTHVEEQKSIDGDITNIVQDMDNATVQYVKDTE